MPDIDVSEFAREVVTLDVPARTSRIRLIPFDEVEVGTEPTYLVKGLIPRTGLTTVWGPPKSGKSFWTFDLVMHVALNREYRGRRVHGGPVVYIAAEGASGLRARVAAFRQERLAGYEGPVPCYIVPVNLDLIEEHRPLIEEIRLGLGTGTPPVAVVIDTLNRTLRGSESSDQDMAAYIAAADAIREAFDCAVIVVHHCGIDRTRPRGHTSLGGAVDAQIAVKKDESGTILATVEWMKDGPEGDTVASHLVLVEVGIDQDGDVITSCIIEPAEHMQAPAREVKLTGRERRALEVLDNVLADYGETAPETKHFPPRVMVVPVDTWRKQLFLTGVLDRDAKNPRTDFKRLRERLDEKGMIRQWEGLMWKVKGNADK